MPKIIDCACCGTPNMVPDVGEAYQDVNGNWCLVIKTHETPKDKGVVITYDIVELDDEPAVGIVRFDKLPLPAGVERAYMT